MDRIVPLIFLYVAGPPSPKTVMTFLYSDAARRRHPELFQRDDRIDRWQCERVVPMRVLALGFARTGTVSVRQVLQRLGIPTYHFHSTFCSGDDLLIWEEAFRSKYFGGQTPLTRNFWDKLLGHVSAVTDFPAIAFAEELIVAYPEAKLILWEREEDAWYQSFVRASVEPYRGWSRPVFAWLDPDDFGRSWRMITQSLYLGKFRARNASELQENARRVYREHFVLIRELIKFQPGKSLEYKLDQGWEPICTFLELEVPEEQFPHANDSRTHAEMVSIMMIQMAERVLWRWSRVLWPILLATAIMRYWTIA